MDNAMVKRGIGAVVLAIIAALLLGYLLKDKSRERQDVVEMELPGAATDNKIPSLSATAEDAGSAITEGASNLADNASDTAQNAGATVVAAAAGAGAAMATTANNAADTASTAAGQTIAAVTNSSANTANGRPARPGFSIRPAAPGEQRDTVNPNGSTQVSSAPKNTAPRKSQNSSAPSGNGNNKVVASSSGNKSSYKPRLIKERKTRIVSSSQGSRGNTSKPSKTTKRATKKATASVKKSPSRSKSTASASKSSARKGGYAIQLMATASESRAKKLAKTMNKEGYKSFITRTTSAGKTLYRVRIHAGGNRNAALAAQKKMKRRYQKNLAVQNSLVVSN